MYAGTLNGSLGRPQMRCKWIMNQGNPQWVCFTDQGGGNRFANDPGTMQGAPRTEDPIITPEPVVPYQKTVDVDNSFDPVGWVKENPILAGAMALGLYMVMK